MPRFRFRRPKKQHLCLKNDGKRGGSGMRRKNRILSCHFPSHSHLVSFGMIDNQWLTKIQAIFGCFKSTRAQIRFSQIVYYQHLTRIMAGCGPEKGWKRKWSHGFSDGRRNYKKTSLYRTHSEAKNFILWKKLNIIERKTRLELATPTLARSCSTNWAISAYIR